jgi:hypothetical protein
MVGQSDLHLKPQSSGEDETDEVKDHGHDDDDDDDDDDEAEDEQEQETTDDSQGRPHRSSPTTPDRLQRARDQLRKVITGNEQVAVRDHLRTRLRESA